MLHKGTALGRHISFNLCPRAVSSKGTCSSSLSQPTGVSGLVPGLQVGQKNTEVWGYPQAHSDLHG